MYLKDCFKSILLIDVQQLQSPHIIETIKGCVCLPGHIRHPDGRCIWYEAWCSTLFWENNGNCGENEFYTECKHDNGLVFEIF